MRRIYIQPFFCGKNKSAQDLDRVRKSGSDRLTIFLLVFSILCAASLPVSGFLPGASDYDIYDSVLRLHVPAN